MSISIDDRRIRVLAKGDYEKGPIIYWMSRDQRVDDNWALLFARQLAVEYKAPLAVAFCMVPEYLDATMRHYGFMMRGLQEVENNLRKKNIPFFLLLGEPKEALTEFLEKQKAGALITDFNPLKINRKWYGDIAERIKIPFYQVDAHNIIPAWEVSDKAEYSAYLFRKRVDEMLDDFLVEFPNLKKHKFGWDGRTPKVDWEKARKSLKVDTKVGEVDGIRPGYTAGMDQFEEFINKRLTNYTNKRNDPTEDYQSGLSPYLHFGQISAQRVVLETLKASPGSKSQESFFNEVIIWRELADNYCFYNYNYDNIDGFPNWARQTLDEHRNDFREYMYSPEQFENAETHDELWNAAQMEMVKTGKMHGYMRMYWAKKILEWTPAPEQAQDIAIYLNDRYELDGRDPNGYAGIAWSIGGVHDRPWFEREIFGKIRFMSYNGCKKKFDVDAYIEKVKRM
ncbi:MAG: deoxyribodipyrimidine photo-lyase [candidate division Zixibacteria bacterium]|nr:deoxyribodipyrimidine photo-lyase [candidate division Zixibacteria bacterium]NIR65332.1 deoxyribodipyrimidine photo-lyase [candidate division Zixibacteria bacterium]NIS15044.1 deoxyribodipyrimidine photo-lyase [candidate division Zixibacteria bacterium]NIS47046.1 deoxyribodipyrimidine photo-lyase [candidate division Zixibacteria bacterium]NIT51553.1 deoxyribodipyrimidine photo-lyase [candidate division Zixibacteria bacterium]